MKNIHVLSTPNPSRLYYNNNDKQFQLCEIAKENTILKSNKNIYITSDEEIKEKDWCYDSDGEQILQFNNRVGVLLANQQKEKYGNKSFFKIILTTDQDLIKNGVQAIDDEFLEWFVKNPSCEEIKINYEIYKEGVGLLTSDWRMSEDDKYKIIIPKEESKQETLEKALYNEFMDNPTISSKDREVFVKGGLFGAKWQQERMYSEEEISKAYDDAYHKGYNVGQKDAELHPLALTIADNIHKDKKKWFEQFKNK